MPLIQEQHELPPRRLGQRHELTAVSKPRAVHPAAGDPHLGFDRRCFPCLESHADDRARRQFDRRDPASAHAGEVLDAGGR